MGMVNKFKIVSGLIFLLVSCIDAGFTSQTVSSRDSVVRAEDEPQEKETKDADAAIANDQAEPEKEFSSADPPQPLVGINLLTIENADVTCDLVAGVDFELNCKLMVQLGGGVLGDVDHIAPGLLIDWHTDTISSQVGRDGACVVSSDLIRMDCLFSAREYFIVSSTEFRTTVTEEAVPSNFVEVLTTIPSVAPPGVVQIGLTTYPDIRTAMINAPQINGKIDIGPGDYRLTDGANGDVTFGRHGKENLSLVGAGSSRTTVTDFTRIYTTQSDRGGGLPDGMRLEGLRLLFNNNDGYLMQGGNYGNPPTAIVRRQAFVDIALEGTHQGGFNGTYIEMVQSDDIVFDRIRVALTEQRDFNYDSGGAAFFMASGDRISITNSLFDESGYGRSIAIYNSNQFVISRNLFDRSLVVSRTVRPVGQIVKASNGKMEGNVFAFGSYLELQDVNGQIHITNGNRFELLNGSYGIVIRDSSVVIDPALISSNLNISGNFFMGGAPIRNELINPNSVLVFDKGVNSVYADGTFVEFDAMYIGATNDDRILGSELRDWLSGAEGIDELRGMGGADAFVFSTEIGVSGPDQILDFGKFQDSCRIELRCIPST